MKELLLLEPVRKKGNHQFFMDWFARAWQACGGGIKRRRPLPWPALLAVARLKLSANLPPLSSRRNALLVPGAGYPDSSHGRMPTRMKSSPCCGTSGRGTGRASSPP